MVSVYQTPVDTAKCHLCVCVCVWGVWVSDVSRHCQMSPVCVCVCVYVCVCVCVCIRCQQDTFGHDQQSISRHCQISPGRGVCVCVTDVCQQHTPSRDKQPVYVFMLEEHSSTQDKILTLIEFTF